MDAMDDLDVATDVATVSDFEWTRLLLSRIAALVESRVKRIVG
jgi:hypothetical protein